MKPFILGVLVAVLGFVTYPKWQDILCIALPQHETCQSEASAQLAEQVVTAVPPKLPQKVFKWTDEQGVVHYGEQEVSGAERIDESLGDITVISGAEQAMARNKGAVIDLRSAGTASVNRKSQSYTSAANRSYKREAKKKRCAYLAGKRDGYSMKSPKYKRYSTQYAQECVF